MNFNTKCLRNNYRIILGVLLLLGLGSAITINGLLPEIPKTNFDTSFYQHAGWYISHHGAIPYIEIWSVKPPIHFYIQIILSYVSGGNMFLLHWLNVIGSSLAVVGTVFFTSAFLVNITGKKIAGLVGGLGILSLPYLYIYASMGFRSKIYMIFFGMAAMYLQSQKRPFFSGFLSTLALGLWQFGIIFPLMSLLFTCRLSGKYFRRTFIGILMGGG